jgi:hypothetical protein
MYFLASSTPAKILSKVISPSILRPKLDQFVDGHFHLLIAIGDLPAKIDLSHDDM